MHIESHRLEVGASIGIARYPEAGAHAYTLLRHADAAMYAAKSSGGGFVRVFDIDITEMAATQARAWQAGLFAAGGHAVGFLERQ